MSNNRAYPIPNLVQGVSQQAPSQRRDSQCEDQLNCVNSPVFGATARPGTNHGWWFKDEVFDGAYIQDVIRTPDEQYRIVIQYGEIRVFDLLTGEEGTVTVEGANDTERQQRLLYLQSTADEYKDVFRTVTIEDTTFIMNREVVPAMLGPTAVPPYFNADPDDDVFEAFIYFRSVDYHARYTVNVNPGSGSQQYTLVTLPGDVATNQANVRTTPVAGNMFSLMTGGSASGVASSSGSTDLSTQGFTITRVNNLIRLRRRREDGGDFIIAGFDDSNGDKMVVIKGPVQRFAQLPTTMFNQAILSVKPGADQDAGDNQYWVEFEGEGFSGTYIETFAPGAETFLNRATMPHLLVSLGNNQFQFKFADWSTRVAGDGVESAKDPSFIGKPIEDMSLWRDRLCIVTEAGFALSKTSQFYTYFPDTVQTALDTDPIDARVVHRKVALLRHAVSHGGQLFLWANGVQFGVESKEALSQSSIEIEPTTSFEYDVNLRPLSSGDNIVYATNIGNYAAIREQFATSQGIGKEYADITSHVPGYVPANLMWLEGSDALKMYACASVDEPNSVYVYQYLVQGEEKAQSAWNKWTFPTGHRILHGSFWNGLLRLCVGRPDGVTFETIDLSAFLKDQAADYNTRIDRKVSELDCEWEWLPAGVGSGYSGTTEYGVTRIRVPYTWTEGEPLRTVIVISRAGGVIEEGTEYEVVAYRNVGRDYGEVDIREQLSAEEKFWVGVRVRSELTFSRFIPKDDKGPYTFERIQVLAYVVSVSDTGWTEAVVEYENGTERTVEFSGRVMGSPTNNLGEVALYTGDIRIPIKSDSKRFTLKLVNDSPFPSAWQAAEVHWRPTVRAQRSG